MEQEEFEGNIVSQEERNCFKKTFEQGAGFNQGRAPAGGRGPAVCAGILIFPSVFFSFFIILSLNELPFLATSTQHPRTRVSSHLTHHAESLIMELI